MREARGSVEKTVWCAWGAAAAAMPFTLRASYIFLPQVPVAGLPPAVSLPAIVAPLQPAMPSVAVALLVFVTVKLCLGVRPCEVLARVLRAWAPPAMVLALVVALVCELLSLPHRFENFDLIEQQGAFDAVGGAAQAVGLALWSWYGVLCVPAGEGAGEMPRSGLARVLLTAMVAPVVVTLITLLPMEYPLVLGALLCLASGVAAWRFCRRLLGMALATEERELCLTVLLGGMLCAVAARDFTNELALSCLWVLLPVDVLAGCLAAYGAVVLLVACALLRRPRQRMKPMTELQRAESVLGRLSSGCELGGRQKEVLARVALGRTSQQIADELGLSMGTVGTHRSRGLAKLGISDRELIRAFEEDGLGDDDSGEIAHRQKALGLAVLTVFLLAATQNYVREDRFGSSFSNHPIVFEVIVFWAMTTIIVGLIRLAGRKGHFQKWENGSTDNALILQLSLMELAITLHGLWAYSRSLGNALLFLLSLASLALAMGSFSHKIPSSFIEFAGEISVGFYRTFVTRSEALLSLGCALLVAGIITDGGTNVIVPARVMAVPLLVCLTIHLYRVFARDGFSRSDGIVATAPWNEFDYLRSRGLSESEAKTASLIAQGFTSSQIQQKMNVAAGTVNSCRAAVYRKLEIHSAAELKDLLKKSAGKERR